MKKVILSLCSTLYWIGIFCADQGYTLVDNQAKLPFLSPDLAERKIMKLRLSNGLEAYLISDPKVDQSGALLTVRVGSWDEPDENPGLAHYLEHMLFLGTKKYPEESGYQRFISENGGTANAFTTNSFTSYLFSINNSSFEEALDRFASFFREPLFNPSGIAREVNAIDQEYAKNIENDDIRLIQVDKQLANPKHPYRRFSMGNRATLSNVSRKTFEEWYKKHYSSHLMRLIVYSNLPLERLKEMVVEDFSGIPTSDYTPFSTSQPLLDPTTAGKMIYIEPIQNKRTLTMMWEMPPRFADMKETLPDKIVCFILGHEGEESLLAQLKREGLADKLECGRAKIGAKNSLLYIDVELTDKGIKELNEVIVRVYQAINSFREHEIPQYVFDEIKRTATLKYQYQSREEAFQYLMKLAQLTADEPLETYPEHTLIIQKFDPSHVQDLFNLMRPKDARIYVTAPSAVTTVNYDKKEKWTDTTFGIVPTDVVGTRKWDYAYGHEKITLPPENPFIPKNLSLVEGGSASDIKTLIPHPELILQSEKGEVYFAQDAIYRVPEVFWFFEIKTPAVDLGNPSKVVLADLYVKSIKEALKKFSYPASQAGLEYDVKRTDFGIAIAIAGYSENAASLYEKILTQLRQVHPTEEEFESYKDSLRREYQNYAKKPPLQQATELLKTILYKRYSTERHKYLSISKITYDKFNDFVFHLFDETYLEGLLYGNMNKATSEELTKKLLAQLDGAPYPKDKQQHREVIILPKQEGPFYLETSTKSQGNAVLLAVEHPYFDVKARAVQQILMQALETPFYSSLRTQQQTGYIVYSSGEEIKKTLFDIFAVQSNSHNVRDLLARFELFIEGFLQEMEHDVTEERFNAIRDGLVSVLEHPANNVKEMGALLQKLAFEYHGDFDWIPKRIEAMKALPYSDFLTMSRLVLGRQNKQRVAVLLNGVIPPSNILNYQPIKAVSKLRKISEYSLVP